MQKRAQYKIKGMQRDMSISAFSPEYAYENKNVRIMPTDDSTLFSLINEKGTKLCDIGTTDNSLAGIPIGQCLIGDDLVIFTAGVDSYIKEIDAVTSRVGDISHIISEADISIPSEDTIYLFNISGDDLTSKILYKGNLGFDAAHPIETLPFYENENIKKVYWTDGINQPRVINIADPDGLSKWNDDSFNFVRNLRLTEEVSVTKEIVAGGSFSPGTIQYALTYFTKYGQESNIFYTSPLHYISYGDRGASPEDKVGNSFTIQVKECDPSFDYVRVYSIHRTSVDAVPTVKIVADIAPSMIYNSASYPQYSVDYDIVNLLLRSKVNGDTFTAEILLDIGSAGYPTRIAYGETFDRIIFPDGSYINIGPSEYVVIITAAPLRQVLIHSSGTTTVHFQTSVYSVSYNDNGTTGSIVDPSILLYIGGEEIVAGTIAQKDNTMFLGNIELRRKMIDKYLKDYFRTLSVRFTVDNDIKSISSPVPVGYYPYDNQLQFNSTQFRTFKYLETYRFGIQLQHVTGKWSEPIYICDAVNTQHITNSYSRQERIGLPIAMCTLSDRNIISRLNELGYKKIRAVVVYPSASERDCICQGILCPTVYNVGDRYGNAPFAQSSWFTRPNAAFNIWSPASDPTGDWDDRVSPNVKSIESRSGATTNDTFYMKTGKVVEIHDVVNSGAYAEFRHDFPIPSANRRNAEIQCIVNPPETSRIARNIESEINTWVANHSEFYFIDQSIVTLHSPDIEFDDNIRNSDLSKAKLRIVGIVPVTSFASDINIQTSTPPMQYNAKDSVLVAPGIYEEPVNSPNLSRNGWKGLISAPFWFDEVYDGDPSDKNPGLNATAFVVYPWHRNGSLNNASSPDINGYRTSMLDKKKMSNMRYSYNTHYLDQSYIWRAESPTGGTGISGAYIFDSNEVQVLRIPSPLNSDLPDINYYGNVDKVLNITRWDEPISGTLPDESGNPTGNRKYGYPIVVSYAVVYRNGSWVKEQFSGDPHQQFIGKYAYGIQSGTTELKWQYGTDPIRIKYKSTPHAVLALNYSTTGAQYVLPTLYDGDVSKGNIKLVNPAGVSMSGYHHFWDKRNYVTIRQDSINVPLDAYNGSLDGYGPEFGFLWLGELYNDTVVNKFGGTTEEALENNQWLPCGHSVPIKTDDGALKDNITILWTDGDTYYQRYDHLKTYPFTMEDQNSVTDIISFMCETRVNIDGRYDKNRGQTNNLAVTPTNFNLINNVYSQKDNFFTYRTINSNKINIDNFRNIITWTNTKTAGELIDKWTNITLASTLDLDGDKGIIRAIRRFNNELIAFQDKGICNILFNSRTQLSTTEGIPVEIANSGKVDGKRYISDKLGCTNKWSICETSNGIYFIDDITKGIFLFNGGLDNLSDRLGFHSWINSRSNNTDVWGPYGFNNFVTYYDKVNSDVFFISKDECLAFSEPLGQFTSFYSYEGSPYFSNIKDKGIFIHPCDGVYKLWMHNEGDYNMFFDKYCPFYTTIIANPDEPVDKIFDTIEFRSDSWDSDSLLNSTFDTLTVWNEYQRGTTSLVNTIGRPSSLKKKFRVWRALVPRDEANKRDRIRNTWAYIKLSMENKNTNKTILHDIIVNYFE